MSNHVSDVHEALLQFVQDKMSDPVIVLDQAGRVVGANRAATVWGHPEILTAFSMLVDWGSLDPQLAAFWRELRDTGYAITEIGGESPPHFQISGYAVADRYVIHGNETMFRSTRVVHDLNDALAPVVVLAGVLRRERSKRVKSIAQRIETSAMQAADLARSLRQVPGTMRPQEERVDIASAVQAMREPIERVLGPDITVAIEVEVGVPATLKDPARLVDSLLDLASNALDPMPNGGCLSIRVISADNHPGMLVALYLPRDERT